MQWPGRVEDILEACGAFDLGSSPSRDVSDFILTFLVFLIVFCLRLSGGYGLCLLTESAVTGS